MDKKLVGLITIFFLSFTIFISILVFNKPLTQLINASLESGPSPTNSMILAWPLTLKADGISESTITVFLRDNKKFPIANKPVRLTTNLGHVKEDVVNSEKDGKAIFHLLSTTPGLAQVTAVSENTEIIQKVSIKFE